MHGGTAEQFRREHGSRTLEILSLVARRGPMTIAELVAALGVTTTAVRQQVNRLLAEDLLVRGRRSHGPGRPADVLSLSDESRRLFAYDIDEFTRLLMEELTRSQDGEQLDALLRRVHERMTQALGEQVRSGDIAERVERLAALMQERGTIADAIRSVHSTRLAVFTCPYHGLAEARDRLCEMERDTLSQLTGREVQLEQRLADGAMCCAFKVPLDDADRERAGGTSSGRTAAGDQRGDESAPAAR